MPEIRIGQNKFQTNLRSLSLTPAEVSNYGLRSIPCGDMQKLQALPLTYRPRQKNQSSVRTDSDRLSFFVKALSSRVLSRNPHRNSQQYSLRPSTIQDDPLSFAQWSKPFFEDLMLLVSNLAERQAHPFSGGRHDSGWSDKRIAAFVDLYSHRCSQGK